MIRHVSRKNPRQRSAALQGGSMPVGPLAETGGQRMTPDVAHRQRDGTVVSRAHCGWMLRKMAAPELGGGYLQWL